LIPKLFIRYLTWELAKIFVLSSAGFVVLMVIIGLAEEAASHGLGPDIIFKLTPYIIPKALMFAVPATCLFSACVVFGRMASENEIVAIESMGIPKSVLVFPALFLAFIVSLFAVWLNDISFAWSYWGVQRVILESSDAIAYGVLKKQGNFSTDQFSIEVDGVEGRRLINPVITIKNSKKGDSRVVAHEAELFSNPDRHSLTLTVTNGLVQSLDASLRFDDSVTHEIPLKSSQEIDRATTNPSHLYLSQIRRAIAKQKTELILLKEKNALECCSQMLGGDWVGLTNLTWSHRATAEREAEQKLVQLHLVPHRRWANGFSCLAFVVIGIPVAIRMKTSNYSTTFGICFLPILLFYYPLFMFGLEGAKQGYLPPQAAWLGNAVCLSLGAVLMARELRR